MIDVNVVGSWALVALRGEFDLSNADEIRLAAVDLAGRAVTDVTVDLSEVSFIGAAGIGALIAAERLISGAGGRMLIVGASTLIRRVLALASVNTLPLVELPPAPVGSPAGGGEVNGADGELSRLLNDVSWSLLTEATVAGNLQAVVRAAVELVPGCDAATIAVRARSTARSAAVSDLIAVEVDLAQYTTGEGPCLDASQTASRIRVDVLSSDDRFTKFAPAAARLGVSEVLSVPVVVRGSTIGSVNLYSFSRFGSAADAVGAVIASQVAATLATSQVYPTALALARQVQADADTERDLHIAAGVIAGVEQCSLEQAERILRTSGLTLSGSLAAAQRVIGYRADADPTEP